MAIQVQTTLTAFLPAKVLQSLDSAVKANLSLQIAKTLRARWMSLADEKLTTQLQTYRDGIQQEHLRGQAAVVSLLGDAPNRLEHGSPAYDMRDTLLGPKVPIVTRGSGQKGKMQDKTGGYYRAIPFRHQTPGRSGKPSSMRLAKPMGHAYAKSLGAEAAKDIGKAIYAAARKLSPTVSEPHRLAGQQTAKTGNAGARTSKALAPMKPQTFAARLGAGVGGVGKLRPHHKTDIYAGMVRLQKTYQKATQGSYMTFRMISTRNPVGWQHPATPGAQLMKTLAEELPVMAEAVVNNFLRSMSGAAG